MIDKQLVPYERQTFSTTVEHYMQEARHTFMSVSGTLGLICVQGLPGGVGGPRFVLHHTNERCHHQGRFFATKILIVSMAVWGLGGHYIDEYCP